MEITADEITEGDVLIDYGTVSAVVRESLVSNQSEWVLVTVGHNELMLSASEYVRIGR